MKLDMTLRDLMRAQDVTRWQIVRCGKAQSIAEHSWAVGIIAQKLWLEVSGGEIGEAATDMELAALAYAAMWHDVPEVFTGDINTPTKAYLKSGGALNRLKELEDTAGEHYLSATKTMITTPMQHCLKIADYLEAAYFLQEYGQGSYAKAQHVDLIARMVQYVTTLEVTYSTPWREATLAILEQLMAGSEETTSFQRVEALLGKASS